jgi:uncharacterized membrane protein (Fun14 family)
VGLGFDVGLGGVVGWASGMALARFIGGFLQRSGKSISVLMGLASFRDDAQL